MPQLLPYTIQTHHTAIAFDAEVGDVWNLFPDKTILFVIDEQVFKHHQLLFQSYTYYVVPAAEQHKNWEGIQHIVQWLQEQHAQRDAVLVAVGGGAVCDAVGFAASIYKRGITCCFFPTTLLAMVDAAIGGKTAIDVGTTKNLLGTIHFPAYVFYCFSFLKSLPHHEWVNGFAEIVKHGFIGHHTILQHLQANNVKFYQQHVPQLKQLVLDNIAAKMSIVQLDPVEKNERRWLNFGHTLGHAIELLYQLSHGKAVAIGMLFASYISDQLHGTTYLPHMQQLLLQYELIEPIHGDIDSVVALMQHDKKNTSQSIVMVLLKPNYKPYAYSLTVSQLHQYLTLFKQTCQYI